MRYADQLINQRNCRAFHYFNSQCVFQMPNKKEKRKRLKEGYDQYDEKITDNNKNIAACRCLEKRSLSRYFAPFSDLVLLFDIGGL